MNDSAPKHSGFLVVSLPLGIGAGFAPSDLYARLDGYGWLSKYHLNRILIAMVVGAALGLTAGMVLDAKITRPKQRSLVLGWMWTLLAIVVFLFLFLRPAFQVAR